MSSASRGLALPRVLDALLTKMGRTVCWLSHAVGRRKASLGTPFPARRQLRATASFALSRPRCRSGAPPRTAATR